jgi:hypothetical protein
MTLQSLQKIVREPLLEALITMLVENVRVDIQSKLLFFNAMLTMGHF